MENPLLSTGCLSFFTSNHPTHDQQWLQKGSQLTLVCFACFVEIIENRNEPSIRKTRTLQELLNLISAGGILKMLADNESVLLHLFNCLWELTDFDESNTTQNITVIEIVYQLCCSLKSETLVEKVMENLSQKLVAVKNIKKVSPQLDLLGKLLQKIPGLTARMVRQRQNLVAYIAKSTSFPDEGIRSSLFFILTHLYRDTDHCSAIPVHITEVIFRECCEVLTSATSKELQINSIALLQSITRPENIARTSQTITSNMERIITSLKKAFLSRINLVQSVAIGCLNNMVLFDEQVVNSDLTGFLFEVFKTNSETVLALGFQCVSQLLDKQVLYTKGHLLYGFEAILSAVMTTIANRNTKLVKQGFGVLAKVFGNCPAELALITSKNVVCNCLDVISAGFSSLDDGVVLEACRGFSLFLERRHFGCDVPYNRLLAMIESLVGRLKNVCHSTGHWNRVENQDLKSLTIATILEIMKKALDLAMCSKSEQPTMESLLASTEDNTSQELDKFINKLLEFCDQVCIPSVVANLRKFYSTTVPEKFFEILTKLLCTCPMESKKVSEKFAASCFIRIALDTKARYFGKSSDTGLQTSVNAFLETMCCRLLPDDIQPHVKSLFRSCLNKINGTAQELLQVLKQNHSEDEVLKNIQECILVLFYLAYQYSDRLVSTSQLLHALSNFLMLNPSCYEHSVIIARCCTRLYITEVHRETDSTADSSPLHSNAQRILADGISKYANKVTLVYFHDFAMVEWVVGEQDLNPELRQEILELWFNHSEENEVDEREIKLWKEMVDRHPRTLLLLASILHTGQAHAQSAVLAVLDNVLSTQTPASEALHTTLKELKVALQKLFLNQAVEPSDDGNIESILKLLCLLVISSQDVPLDEDYIKLVYHVANLLTRSNNSPKLCIACLNFLNTSIVQDTKAGSDQVLGFLLKHHDYNQFLENTINSSKGVMDLESSQSTTILAVVLVSISYLIHFQKTFGISTKIILKVQIEVVLCSLCCTSSPLLQFAANIFWANVLQANASFTNVLLTTERDTAPFDTNSEQHKLSKVHLRIILVRLQNSMIHSNQLVQLSALRCLEALLSLGEDARSLLQDPWNIVMLREVKDSASSKNSTLFCLQLYSVFLYQKRTKSLDLDFPIADLLQNALEKFSEYENDSDPDHAEKCLSVYARFFREIIQYNPDAITTVMKSNLRCHVEHLIDSYHGDKASRGQSDADFVYIQELLVHREAIHGKSNDSSHALHELLSLLK